MGKIVKSKANTSAVVVAAKTPAVASPEGPSPERVAFLLGDTGKETTPAKPAEVAKGQRTGKESGNTPATPPPALKSVPTPPPPVVKPAETSAGFTAEVKRPAGLNPYCVLPTVKVGTAAAVILRGKIRNGKILANASGQSVLVGGLEGIKENVRVSVSYVFPDEGKAREAIAWAKSLVRTPLTDVSVGDRVATFDATGDLGYGPTMYRGQLTGLPAESGAGMVAEVFYDWEGTSDIGVPAENLRDVRCVTDPLTFEYAVAYVRELHPGDKVEE